ncbi:MAG: GMC family oxidoreductase N-terminal domain-containing protein [Steroidobacteraceae bacterium]
MSTRRWTRRDIGSLVMGTTVALASARGARAADLEDVDFLVVGGGTAGCVLAHRLSADPNTRVMLLEAGDWVDDAAVNTVGAWPSLQGGPHDWAYTTLPQPGIGGRVLPCPRGRGLGGSSLINAMGHQRGDPAGYDAWEALGATGWNAATLLPFHRRSERWVGGADRFRGGDGPLDVQSVDPARASAVAMSFLDAARAAGHGWTDDINGARSHGAGWNQFTIDRMGRRAHAARAYLEPVRTRSNLHIATGARVLRLQIEADRCTGLTLLRAGAPRTVRARRGVIMAAGAIDTPRLLMLSGIGPAAALQALDIDVVVDSAEVGANLHDHPLVGGVAYEAREAVAPSAYNHGEGMLFTRLGQGSGVPDTLVMCVTVPFVIPTVGVAPDNCYTLVPCVMQPRSRGSVALQSADPLAAARIDPATFAAGADLEQMVDAIELCRDLAATLPLRSLSAREVYPGPAVRDRGALRDFARRGASPFYHPVGTMRMGSDPGAPVGPDLRVRGVQRLWVADASVMPRIVPAMTNAATIAIAERAADLISASAASA